MLSKKIEFNLLSIFKKDKSNIVEENTTEDRRRDAIETSDFQTKASGFAIGFLINLAFCALLFSIALVII